MTINISSTVDELGEDAAQFVEGVLQEVIRNKGEARMVVSTGASQLEMLNALIKKKIEWDKVEVFHLDEYINLPITHPASFRKYLKERFADLVPLKKIHYVRTEGDISGMIKDLTAEIRKKPLDLGLIGIGENAHIAFNDPPANFDTREAFIRVYLDEQCKKQQVGEGWFKNLEEVPREAVTMTVHQIMQCETIVSCVPHLVKASAVYKTLNNSLTPGIPATALKEHSDFNLFLDRNSASEIIRW